MKRFALILTIISIIVGLVITVYNFIGDNKNDNNDKNVSNAESNSGNAFNIGGNGNTIIINSQKEDESKKKPNGNLKETKVPNNKVNNFKSNGLGIRIAIIPFEYISSNNNNFWLSKGIPEALLISFSNSNKYIVIEGNLRDKVLSEIEFQQGKYVDEKTAVRIGKLMGVDQLVIGSCQIVEDKVKMVSRIVNVESGRIEGNCIIEHEGEISNILNEENIFAKKVFDCLIKN